MTSTVVFSIVFGTHCKHSIVYLFNRKSMDLIFFLFLHDKKRAFEKLTAPQKFARPNALDWHGAKSLFSPDLKDHFCTTSFIKA